MSKWAADTLEDWTAALPDLKRRGSEYVGPCPSCGGGDRFHVKAGHTRAVFGDSKGAMGTRRGAYAAPRPSLGFYTNGAADAGHPARKWLVARRLWWAGFPTAWAC